MEESHGRGGGEREGRGGVDKEMEGRISAAVCQPRPVGVFIRFQNHRTHVFPPQRHPEASLVVFLSDSSARHTDWCAIRAAKTARACCLLWAEQLLIKTHVMQQHAQARNYSCLTQYISLYTLIFPGGAVVDIGVRKRKKK